MEDEEILDSNIVGQTEEDELYEQIEELQGQIAEKDERIEQLESDNEELRSNIEDLNGELSYLNSELESYEDKGFDLVSKSKLLDDIELHLKRDNMWTSELEEWFEQYYKFYLDNID